MSVLSCIFGRHSWYAVSFTGLNAEFPTGWRCLTCGATTKRRKR